MGEEVGPPSCPRKPAKRPGEKLAKLPGLSPSFGLGCRVDTTLDVSRPGLGRTSPLAGWGGRG